MKGLKELEAKIRKISSMSTKNAIKETLPVIENQAVKLTPVDTGALRSSVRIGMRNDDTGVITYLAKYATYVHEDLTSNHTVGEAKFLEKAVNSTKKVVLKELGKNLSSIYKIGR